MKQCQLYCNNLVNITDILRHARQHHYAIGHFNIVNLGWAKALLEIAHETNTPLIIGVSESAVKYMGGYNTVSDMVTGLIHDLKIKVPVALHLDHGQSLHAVRTAIHAGFSSVMFDGSHLRFEKNLKIAKQVATFAKRHFVSYEFEVGTIGGSEDNVYGRGELANLPELQRMATLKPAALAAGIGNVHGVYPPQWPGLAFDLLANIKTTISLPLVLHGGSGIPREQIRKAIQLGIAKVNVNTECQMAFCGALRAYFMAGHDREGKGYDPRIMFQTGYAAIKDVFCDLTKLFGSFGQAKQ